MIAGIEVTGTQAILYEKRDGVAWITLNRPEVMNAQNDDFRNGLARAMMRATEEDDVYVIVIIGAGGRAFSAGNDLKAAQAARDAELAGTPREAPIRYNVADCPKPIIAAIDGFALAAGLELSLACDIRIATEQSTFGLPEVKRGRLAGPGLIELHRMIPLGEAKWIQLTGARMSARRAYDIGLIQALLPDREALMAEAERIAGEIKECSPLSVEATKRIVNLGRSIPPEYARAVGGLERQILDKSEDLWEGLKAFNEKRAPVWKRR